MNKYQAWDRYEIYEVMVKPVKAQKKTKLRKEVIIHEPIL